MKSKDTNNKNKVLRPDVVRGGSAIPIGKKNFYYMKGRKHESGGIDIGKNAKTGLEVEDGEVMHITPKMAKVFSSVPFLNGESPAEKVIKGENPNVVFNKQEQFKDDNKLNDDGTKKYKQGGLVMGSISNRKPFSTGKITENKHGRTIAKGGTEYVPEEDIFNEAYHKKRNKLYNESDSTYNSTRGNSNKFIDDPSNIYTTKDAEVFGVRPKKLVENTRNNSSKIKRENNIDLFNPELYPKNNKKFSMVTRQPKETISTENTNPETKENNISGNKNTSNPINNPVTKSKYKAKPKEEIKRVTGVEQLQTPRTGLTINKPSITNPKINTPPIPSYDSSTKSKNNKIIPKNLIGLTGNVLGSIGSFFTNKSSINNLKPPTQPTSRQAAKLKTRINIEPQLDKMREAIAAYERDVTANTASSRVSLARNNKARLVGAMETNQLYGNKENIETQLINQDRLNSQQVADRNITEYNAWRQGVSNFNNAKTEAKGENTVGLIGGINASIQDALTREEKDDQFNENVRTIRAGAPNVSDELLRHKGINIIERLNAKIKSFRNK